MNHLKQTSLQLLAALGLLALATTTPLFAAPVAPENSIRAAVSAAGAPSVKKAEASAFLKAFASVISGVKQKEVAGYVAAAVKLRPDLAPGIVRAALAQLRSGDKALICDLVASVIKAAVGANPDAAAAIVKQATEEDPAGRACILAAAISAAPDAKEVLSDSEAFDQAARRQSSDSGESALLRRPSGSEAGGFDAVSAGTLNPANISGTSNSNEKGDRVTICHRSGNGRGQTLTLPRKAAEQHLRNHPRDTLGACP